MEELSKEMDRVMRVRDQNKKIVTGQIKEMSEKLKRNSEKKSHQDKIVKYSATVLAVSAAIGLLSAAIGGGTAPMSMGVGGIIGGTIFGVCGAVLAVTTPIVARSKVKSKKYKKRNKVMRDYVDSINRMSEDGVITDTELLEIIKSRQHMEDVWGDKVSNDEADGIIPFKT